jgi:hypothetical protein
LRNVRYVRRLRESAMTVKKTRRCATSCGRPAEVDKDLCSACKAAFDRMYGTKDQDQESKTMASKKSGEKAAAGKRGGKKAAETPYDRLPLALRTGDAAELVDVTTILDRLYEVAAGDASPETYGFKDRAGAVEALGWFGADGKPVLARAEAAHQAREERLAAERAAAEEAAKRPELDLAEEEGEEGEEPSSDPAGAAPPAVDASGSGAAGSSAPSSAGGAPERGAAKDAPAWRSTPSRLLKAALRPLDPQWCDWKKVEAEVPGVLAARELLKNALEKQLRIEAAGGGSRAASGKVEVGGKARVKKKNLATYEAVLGEEERSDLLVKAVAGNLAHCVTKGGAGDRVSIQLSHLEAEGA